MVPTALLSCTETLSKLVFFQFRIRAANTATAETEKIL